MGRRQVPGDGRELVAAVRDAVTVRAEDGRRVEATDISPFISRLPFGAPPPASPRCLPASHSCSGSCRQPCLAGASGRTSWAARSACPGARLQSI